MRFVFAYNSKCAQTTLSKLLNSSVLKKACIHQYLQKPSGINKRRYAIVLPFFFIESASFTS